MVACWRKEREGMGKGDGRGEGGGVDTYHCSRVSLQASHHRLASNLPHYNTLIL